jgi:hypothetical protein
MMFFVNWYFADTRPVVLAKEFSARFLELI